MVTCMLQSGGHASDSERLETEPAGYRGGRVQSSTVITPPWVFIAGITPTNYSVSYIVKKINAYERVELRPFTIKKTVGLFII